MVIWTFVYSMLHPAPKNLDMHLVYSDPMVIKGFVYIYQKHCWLTVVPWTPCQKLLKPRNSQNIKIHAADVNQQHLNYLFSDPHLFGIPSPFCATVFLGSTSTSLLNSLRNSGVIVFGCGGGAAGSAALSLPDVLPPLDGPDSVCSEDFDGSFWLYRGAGKFCFLSTASTSRWNLLNRVSARIRVASRSIVLESSLTV